MNRQKIRRLLPKIGICPTWWRYYTLTMAHIKWGTYGPNIPPRSSLPKNDHAVTGLCYANAAIDFAALGNAAEKAGIGGTPLHLYALAIELAFKAVAILFGASPDDCRKASHRIAKVIELFER